MDPAEDPNETPTQGLTEERVVELIREAMGGFKQPAELDLTKIVEQVKAQIKTEPAPADPKPPGVDPQVAELREQLESLQAERKEAQEAARRERVQNQVQRSLINAKAAPERVGVAMSYLLSNGQVAHQDDGSIVFVGQDKYGQTVHKPLDKGIEEFLSSDTGKMFLPPRPVQGSGSGGGNPFGVSGGRDTNPEALAKSALSRFLSGAVQNDEG